MFYNYFLLFDTINVIIFCNYMFCEVYKSNPYIQRISGRYLADIRCSNEFEPFVFALSRTNGNPIRNRADILPLNILWASHYMTSSFASFLTQSLLVSQLKLVTSHLLQCLILPCLVDYYISNSF